MVTAGECRCISGDFQILNVLDTLNIGRLIEIELFIERECCSKYQK